MTHLPRLVRRVALAAAAVLSPVSMVAPAAAAPAAASDAHQSPPAIDTYEHWDGSSHGCLNRLYSTCGQVITIPAGTKRLKAFSLYLLITGTDRAAFRGEVYTWDGEKAGREIWESERRTLKSDPQFDYTELHFEPGRKVEAGRQYVLFLTFSKDYASLDPNTSGDFAAVPADLLPDGHPASLDDAGRESLWTQRPWSTDDPQPWELAIKVWTR